jgi:hypothetical protein
MSAVESNQIAQGEKVTALVPGVENGSEMLWRLQNMQNLATFWRSISSQETGRSRVSPFYFWRGIDLIPRVG